MDVRSSMIVEGMDVVASDGVKLGQVDFVREGCLVLRAASSPDRQAHAIPIHWVGRIDGSVRLNKNLQDVRAHAARAGASETDAVPDHVQEGSPSGHPGASETDAMP